MLLQRVLLLTVLGIFSSRAQDDLQAVNQLKAAHADSRAKLSQKWASDQPALSELLCAKPTNAGHVVKNSNVQDSPTVTLSRPVLANLKAAGLPVYTACQVYVSDTWRFIFMRNPKASSTAVLAAIRNQLCNRSCSDEQFRRVRVSGQLAAKWESYFVFTIVRNPWLRGLSAYTMFTGSFLRKWPQERNAEPREKCGLPFDKFAENAFNMRSICEQESCCAHIPSKGFVPGLVDTHIADQSHCVFLPNGDSLVDYIGTAEDLDAAWADIVAAINDRAATTFEALPVKNPNGRGPEADGGVRHTCDSDNVLGKMTSENAYGLARQYAHDVVHFGYVAVE